MLKLDLNPIDDLNPTRESPDREKTGYSLVNPNPGLPTAWARIR